MTRVKICGITRVEDALAAARLGADAIGLMFYSPSPRCVTPEQARRIAGAMPPFVTVVGVFVDPSPEEVRAALAALPLGLLQFHGDEAPEFCAGFGVDYIKAARVRPGLDLVQYAARHGAARGLLLDAFVPGAHGGTGQGFDWSLIPPRLPLPVILSGGLDASNVVEAIRRVRPWAVDVSSGVEAAKGIKDPARISAFIRGVRDADV
jgi:phosphoribosylanthranilate isomerase